MILSIVFVLTTKRVSIKKYIYNSEWVFCWFGLVSICCLQ
ncbi:hypothetical protein NC653_038991 [Populus alba x Populus x berolinensis]|uniref:Uncharacterized protein n=1 Tax=Populus alba x Populus x berolinensis TaxID=444605 RepID=A0AAD6PRL5_9ROSI|nr:hypothetical protein NC653_038991 [Populus alba x Populus x berolinensis]